MKADATSEHNPTTDSGSADAGAAGRSGALPACHPHSRLGCARLPVHIALDDSVLFWWCGRIVTAARRKPALDAADAADALPKGARKDITAQVGWRLLLTASRMKVSVPARRVCQ